MPPLDSGWYDKLQVGAVTSEKEGLASVNIFFDLDYTLLAIDGSLRPGVKELFQRLVEEGHDIYIWSGLGVRWGEVRRHGLDAYVKGVFDKPLHDFGALVKAWHQRGDLPILPDLVVDDYPEIVTALGGVLARPYFFVNPGDREMERIYQIIQEYSSNGHSPDAAFRPRPPSG